MMSWMCSVGVYGGSLHAQGVGVGIILLDEAVAQLLYGGALLVGPADHLVVDVGEVLDEGDLVAPVLEIPA